MSPQTCRRRLGPVAPSVLKSVDVDPQVEKKLNRQRIGPKGRQEISLGWSEAEAQELFFVRE
jgi:hypothetical protein